MALIGGFEGAVGWDRGCERVIRVFGLTVWELGLSPVVPKVSFRRLDGPRYLLRISGNGS